MLGLPSRLTSVAVLHNSNPLDLPAHVEVLVELLLGALVVHALDVD